jgi:sensor c-di-GMP phosphodiesterase-like protein
MFLKTLEINDYDKVKVSVNITPNQILHDDFVSDLTQIVNETKITPSNLGIEITEVSFSDNYEVINEKLERLKRLGIIIAIDDFGTGYSSLARERELNVNCLKIDKYFIDKLRYIHQEEAITGDIISMAHRLGHLVVAEGVEYEEQKEYLIQKNCDCMQGYLYSKPLPLQAAIEFLYEI